MIEPIFETNNLNIASFLYTFNLKFLGTYRKDKAYIFKFAPKEKAEELVSNYFTDKVLINPRELFGRLKDLKDLIFNKI